MSLKTWIKQYYPVKAGSKRLKTDYQRTAHSLKKWLGLKSDAIGRHGLVLTFGTADLLSLTDFDNPSERFVINADTCALCLWYIDDNFSTGGCANCPLKKTLGIRCDYDRNGPWRRFKNTGDPDDMIAALSKTLTRLKKEAKKK